MRVDDVGCHVATMCAQAVEKSLKGYVFLNGNDPKKNHRSDKYLPLILDPRLFLGGAYHKPLVRVFDKQNRVRIKQLLDLTPGGSKANGDKPNTEYPWSESNRTMKPAGAATFQDPGTQREWVRVAKQMCSELEKIVSVEERAASL